MAKKLKDMPAGSRSRYPWDEWFDGDVWELEAEKDYSVSTENMRTAVHSAAGSRGGHAQTSVTEKGLAIQFFEGENPNKTTRAPAKKSTARKSTAAKKTAKKAPAKKTAAKKPVKRTVKK